MNKTNIEWVKNPDGSQGFTWNPITGCLNGCGYCYARKLANGRLRTRYLANNNWADLPKGKDDITCRHFDPFYPRFWEDRLDQLNPVYGQDHRAIFKGIFVCDMSDLFGIGIPESWTNKVLDRIKEFPYHRFYLLTKQPQNLIKFSPFPDNCWVGVSVTNNDMMYPAYCYLGKVKAKVKFISFEPLLDGISEPRLLKDLFRNAGIGWVIIGSQTKPYKPPKIEWVEEIIGACDKARIPVFLKHNLRPLLDLRYGGFPKRDDFDLRQEMPS